ncbi:MAG: hypothetical protein ACYC66_07015 [Chloroflexota bacterium]
MRFLKKLHRKYILLALGAIVVSLVASACAAAESKPAPSSMEVVQGSYLHLTSNITDLRTRITNWQKGDADSLDVAEEKLERIQAVLASTGWPSEMARSVARTKAAAGPMDRALKGENQSAAEAASVEFGEAFHDIIHEFYGDHLPAMEGMESDSMAAHGVYMDLANNLVDLQTRIANWQKGDEGSMGVAKEKAERIEILIPHLYSTGVVVKDLPPIQTALPAVFAAIERQDAEGTAQAAKPIAAAAQQLNRDFYSWMELERAGNDPACVQASYLEITRNISDLRAGVTAWGKGDAAGSATAAEKLARVDLLLTHTAWPEDMATAIDRTANALVPMAEALKARSLPAAEAASAELGEGSHDITHDYYGVWLPAGGLQGAKAQASSQRKAQTSGSGGHGHDGATADAAAEGPNWPVIAGFAAVMALVIFGAALTKPKAAPSRVGSPPGGA